MMRVEGLNFSYPCGRQILRDISFQARSGSFLAILGNNGAGNPPFSSALTKSSALRPAL